MKPRTNPLLRLAAAVAFAATSAAYAQVVNINNQTFNYGTLLTDNFNTPSYNPWTFNDNLAADQAGILDTVTYSITSTNSYEAQHSNGGAMLLTSDGWWGNGAYASLNHNFATDANTASQPLQIQFDMWATGGDNPDWIGFGLNNGQGQLFYEGAYGIAATVGDGTHNYKLVISDTAGTGSGFNGITNGAKIELFKDNVSQGVTNLTLATDAGYITFRTIPSAWTGWNIGLVDNLKITNGQATNPLATGTELNLSNNGIVNFGDVTQTVAKLDGTSGTQVNLVPVAGTSSLTVNGSVDSAFAGVISGSGGSLTKDGSGTLTLSGANTYTGNTTLSNGVLEVTSSGKLHSGGYTTAPTVTVGSGTVLKLNGWDYDSAGSLGALDFSRNRLVINGGTIEYVGATNSTNGGAAGRNFTVGIGGATLKASSGSGQLWFIAANTDFGYGNLVNDNGLTLTGSGDGHIQKVIEGTGSITKSDAGTWMLSGTNTYTGSTNVNTGTLLITGSTAAGSAVTVASGGTLGGTGTVGGPTTIQWGGTLNAGSGGDSKGTLDFGGTLGLSGTTTFDIGGDTRGTGYDGIDVTGALTNGGALSLNFTDLFANGSYTFDLFSFDSQSGDFTSVSVIGSYVATLTNNLGVWSGSDITGNSWTYTQSTGDLGFTAVPEPTSALAGLLLGAGLLRRRRKA